MDSLSARSEWRSRGYLPHFDAPDLVQMLTFRLADAVPSDVLLELKLDARYRREAARKKRLHEYLDAGHGACYLRDPAAARIVQNALFFFDVERYLLLAWSVMPNHVHVLIETLPAPPLDEVAHSWKSYTSNKINELVGRAGRLWQPEYFDRFIRNEEHLRNAIGYIHGNVSWFSSAEGDAGH